MTTPDQGMPQEAPPAPGQTGSNGLAIAGLICAIAGLVLFFLPFVGFGVSVLGLILAIVGMKNAGSNGGAGKGVAIAGIVVAVFGLLGGGATSACTLFVGAKAHEAAESAGFHSFGDMMKAAADMPKQLDAAAKKAGYPNYQAWHEKDPKAAQAAADAIGKKLGARMKKDTNQMNQGGAAGSGAGGSSGN